VSGVIPLTPLDLGLAAGLVIAVAVLSWLLLSGLLILLWCCFPRSGRIRLKQKKE